MPAFFKFLGVCSFLYKNSFADTIKKVKGQIKKEAFKTDHALSGHTTGILPIPLDEC